MKPSQLPTPEQLRAQIRLAGYAHPTKGILILKTLREEEPEMYAAMEREAGLKPGRQSVEKFWQHCRRHYENTRL